MSNNKQSSVEFLMDKLFDPSSMVEEQLEWFEQAKAIHKEEIEEAYIKGHEDRDFSCFDREQYYNQKFNNEQTN